MKVLMCFTLCAFNLICVTLASCLSRILCPNGYQAYKESCYKFNDEVTVSREAANTACKSQGAHLVDITSEEEQNMLSGYLSAAKAKDMWIGLGAQIPGGELVWTDGSPLDFTAWSSTGRNEKVDCVRLEASESYKWSDRGCSLSFGYICEIEVGDSSSVKGANANSTTIGYFFTLLQNPADINIISLDPQILLSDDKSVSLLYCAILCHRTDSCAAFVFSQKQQLCTLYDSIVKSFKVTDSAAVHYALLC